MSNRKIAPLRKGFAVARNAKVKEIDADTWAESGGTVGIFGKLFMQGRLKIVPAPEDGSQIIPE